MKQIRSCMAVCVGLLVLLAGAGCRRQAPFQTTEGETHTYYRIKYRYGKPLDKEIAALFKAYDHAINPFDSTSIISAVNRNDTTVRTDTLFRRAFRHVMEVSRLTDGLFDATCAPLINYWGFGFKTVRHRTPADIDSLKQFVGYRKIRLEGDRVVKDDPRVQLNFSAIGDGYICDLVGELLDRKGVEDYLVDIGGEMLAKGLNPQGKSWTIGINKPIDDSTQMNNEIQQVIRLHERRGIATSGNYRNFYIQDGKKYAHTINPQTGYPAAEDILSATVIAQDCTTADAFATSFMVMGRHRAESFLKQHPELEYYFIYAGPKGEFLTDYSPGMKNYLVETPAR